MRMRRIFAVSAAVAALMAALGCGGGGGGGAGGAPPAAGDTATAPVASFRWTPVAPVSGQTVGFTDTSTGRPTSWSWDFGDGATSTQQSPSHAYAAAGTFTATLTAANAAGSHSATHTVEVSAAPAAPTAGFTFAPADAVTAQTVDFTDASTGGPTSWSWDFGDGATSVKQNPSHAYAAAGAYMVTLTAANAAGASAAVHELTVRRPDTPGTSSFLGTVVLGAPTRTTVKASVLSAEQAGTAYVRYGTSPGLYDRQTPPAELAAGEPLVLTIDGLTADTRYYYRFYVEAPAGTGSSVTEERSFHTAREPGSAFTFTVQADSHLDENSSLDLYRRTLANVAADVPDFHVDLGDTFMCEKSSVPLAAGSPAAGDAATVDARYVYERANFGLVGPSAPLYLVNGNHEGEAGWLDDGTASNLAVWTAQARLRYYANPTPDGFYGGDPASTPFLGRRASWYSWSWGDALFVVLDPYWESQKPNADGWALTLGRDQYDWLGATLAGSAAKFKFVFVHNLVGGLDGQMRGGIEAAPYYEWGGKNGDGSDGFAARRAGWGSPIHQLLVRHGVTAVFHGHDHLYAKQVLDGIVYQEVPQPSAVNTSSGPTLAAAYHYASGTILSSSGHLRVTVGPGGVTSEYVRAWLPANETAQRKNRQVDDRWIAGGASASSFGGNVVLGAPTSNSVRANVYAPSQGGTVYVAYGPPGEGATARTPEMPLRAGEPLELKLEGLQADTPYAYRLYFRGAGDGAFGAGDEHTFHTARAAGSTFAFCVQGDSHPEREKTQFDADLYTRTLRTAAADGPDFYVALGDDFSVDTLDAAAVTAAQVAGRYALQRPYLSAVGQAAPVFLVNGNHEQAARYLLDGTADNVAVWAQNARNSHYSQPAPDGFYTGNEEVVPFIGLLRNYYAWTWGDALFVVIDPYWSSPGCVDNPFGGGPKRTNLWEVTHGDAQYQWLKATLEQSRARYKFVFAHHVLGTGRGGVELAGLYEWGGANGNGSWGFEANRPAWPAPIHGLLADNGVTVFFQGHDHLWARQELDGVVYQTLPEPADPNYALNNSDAYLTGTKLPSSGYARVTVSPSGVKVDYVRPYLPEDEGPGRVSGSVAASYTVP